MAIALPRGTTPGARAQSMATEYEVRCGARYTAARACARLDSLRGSIDAERNEKAVQRRDGCRTGAGSDPGARRIVRRRRSAVGAGATAETLTTVVLWAGAALPAEPGGAVLDVIGVADHDRPNVGRRAGKRCGHRRRSDGEHGQDSNRSQKSTGHTAYSSRTGIGRQSVYLNLRPRRSSRPAVYNRPAAVFELYARAGNANAAAQRLE